MEMWTPLYLDGVKHLNPSFRREHQEHEHNHRFIMRIQTSLIKLLAVAEDNCSFLFSVSNGCDMRFMRKQFMRFMRYAVIFTDMRFMRKQFKQMTHYYSASSISIFIYFAIGLHTI
ncbi:hypothetical protein Droror1_Dr00017511 [Drosera rotundifolia]